MSYKELDEIKYKVINDNPSGKELQKNWNIAFGLQDVDNLKPSKYMVSLAKENIEGKKTYNEVDKEIKTYYSTQKNINVNEKEADEVSLRIVKLLKSNAFIFSIATYKEYHKFLFQGIDIGIDEKYVGNFRDVNLTKEEPVLGGKSVIYADYSMIKETLEYDFNEEKKVKYSELNKENQIKRIARFTANIWQIHPFREGNTRTTAIFIQKYLNSKGFTVNNELFKDNSLYFRNSLVRASYSNIQDGIEENLNYLIKFFENLLENKQNVLDIKELFIKK